MPTLTFPSATFPGLTAVDITAPEEWSAYDQGDTVLALVRKGEPGEFRANLVVSVRRFPVSYLLTEAVDALEQTLTSFPELTDRGGGLMEVAGFPGYAREIGFTDPDVGPLAHSIRVALVALPRAQALDVVDVRATVLLEREVPDHLEVIDMLNTLTLRSAEGN